MFAHPCRDSLIGAALDRCVEGMRVAGAEVRVIELCQEGFDPVLGLDAWRKHLSPLAEKPEIQARAELLRWADTLVLVYPTWYGAQPAILKGWFDRVWVEGVAYTLPPGRDRIRPLLRNLRRIVVITSHGSGKSMNAVTGAAGHRFVRRGLRTLAHPLCRVHWVAFYCNDRASAVERTQFLTRVERTCASIVRHAP